MHVSAFARRAPVRVFRITCRRLVRRSRARLAALKRKPPASEPIRTFSVPSGLSSVRPPLTLVLMATALLACSTLVLGTLLSAGWADPRPTLPAPIDATTLTQRMQTGALPQSAAPAAQACCEGPHQADASRAEDPRNPDVRPALASAPAAEAPAAPEPVVPPGPSAPIQLSSANPTPVLVAPSAPSLTRTSAIPPTPLADPPPVGSFSKPQATPAAPEGPFAGVWAVDEKACSPQLARSGLLPALISAQGAWAGETTCSFKSSKRVGNTWTFAAVCSDARRRWKTNIRMSVAGNRLTWASQRGSQTYVRCQTGLIEAHGQKHPMSPA